MTTVTRDEFETVKELLASAARYAESAHHRLDQLGTKIEQLVAVQNRTQQHLDELGARIDQLTLAQDRTQQHLDQLSAAQDRTQQYLDQLNARGDQLTSDIGNLALQLEQQAQEAQQDRSQAAIDRAEFRSTVEQLLRVLTQQINGNGGNQPPRHQ